MSTSGKRDPRQRRAPPPLYRYRPSTDVSENGGDFAHSQIVKEEIFSSRVSSLNDIFEFRPFVRNSLTDEQLRKVESRVREKHHSDASDEAWELIRKHARNRLADPQVVMDEVRKKFEQFGTTSFSEKPDLLSMWAHYASAFQGYCLRYEFDEHAWKTGLTPMPLDYVRTRSVIDLADILLLTPESVDPSRVIEPALLSKSEEWAAELEWRIIGQTPSTRIKAPGSLKCVILGPRMTEPHREVIAQLVVSRGTAMRVMETAPSEEEFGLLMRPLSPQQLDQMAARHRFRVREVATGKAHPG